ncbi:MAG: PQQ-binding-like beta-propeller repeat protein [Acidimicrobiales bacterium]
MLLCRSRSRVLQSALVLVLMLGAGLLGEPDQGGASATAGDWTVYHHDPAGLGVAGPIRLAHAHQAWVSPTLDGQLFGEPLVVGQTVVVATQNDTVYALNARTGRIRWSTHVGRPVQTSTLPCGNITPTLGITATPVIDPARNEVFVVADVAGAHAPVHELFGLRVSSGSILLRKVVDPPGINTAATLQRVALTLDDGAVVFGDGGNYGDCSTYHGWIISVPETGGPMRTYEVDAAPGDDQGAVWMGGGAPVIDAHGDIWFAAGNGSVVTPGRPYDGSDSVVELSPTLHEIQSFAPAGWASDNAHDRDLGSGVPALLPDGLVVQGDKSQIVYVLSAAKLGGVGGQLAAVGSICNDDVDGGNAVRGTVVFMPCLGGLVAVSVSTSPPSVRRFWQAAAVTGPPILAGGLVWAMSVGGELDGINPSSGVVSQRFQVGAVANHFPSPSAGDGRLFAPGLDQVFAFAGR